MIGTSVSGLITLFQAEANRMLKETKGDIGKIVAQILTQLEEQSLVSQREAKLLSVAFANALDVLAGKKRAEVALKSSRATQIALMKEADFGELARALAELCHAVVADTAITRRMTSGATAASPGSADPDLADGGEALPPALAATVSGKGDQALLWGAVGALVGGSLGGPLGGLIGAGVGAAVGACGDSDTTITPTNNGGSPA